jgi:hypothetical protein
MPMKQFSTGYAKQINSVYDDGRVLSSFNFRVNISTDFSTLNGGAAQSAILINQDVQSNGQRIGNVT